MVSSDAQTSQITEPVLSVEGMTTSFLVEGLEAGGA